MHGHLFSADRYRVPFPFNEFLVILARLQAWVVAIERRKNVQRKYVDPRMSRQTRARAAVRYPGTFVNFVELRGIHEAPSTAPLCPAYAYDIYRRDAYV